MPSPRRSRHDSPIGALRVAGLLGLSILAAGPARPGEPIRFWGGHVRLGGQISAAIAPADIGFFNYTDYRHSLLRLLRLDVAAEIQPWSRLALVGEVRSDNLGSPRPYALYLRARPWAERSFDVQLGRIPPVFGAFPRRSYTWDNPLPGTPLAYQYLTSLRADAVPADADQLVSQRGRGWLANHAIGSPYPAPGMPLVNTERWDVGVQARMGSQPVELAVALTRGTLSAPVVEDESDGKQVAAHLSWRPCLALNLGVSAARGQYLTREAVAALPESVRGSFFQTVLGLDVEYSAGYWIVRAEAVWSRWDVPVVAAPAIDTPLGALGGYLEARYKLRPGLFVATRAEHLGFSEVTAGSGRLSWDAPVSRLEVGVGYLPRRDLLLKAAFQHDVRDGGRVRKQDLLAAQLVFWF